MNFCKIYIRGDGMRIIGFPVEENSKGDVIAHWTFPVPPGVDPDILCGLLNEAAERWAKNKGD